MADDSHLIQPGSWPRQVIADEVERTFPWTLEIALSGGGLRASAFCLGALLYLVHAGLNRKVEHIASVSGGSIANGFVASRCDYAAADLETFGDVAREVAERIANRGLWNSHHAPIYCFAIGALLMFVLALVVDVWVVPVLFDASSAGYWTAAVILLSLLVRYYGGGPTYVVFLIAWVLIAVLLSSAHWLIAGTFLWEGAPRALATIGGILGLSVLVFRRGTPITRWMAETFFADARQLGDLSGRAADHIFCATDLNHGVPFFFSTKDGGRVLSRIRGRADAPGVPLTLAVRASASFPPAIPPVFFRLPQRWTHLGEPQWVDIGRSAVWLTDGGAFNNLGTDWSLSRDWVTPTEWQWRLLHQRLDREKNSPAAEEPSIETRVADSTRFGQVQLVVDASQPPPLAPLRSLHFPIAGAIAYAIRTTLVMYGSTVSARGENVAAQVMRRMFGSPARWRLKTGSASVRLFAGREGDLSEAVDAGALQVFAPSISNSLIGPMPSVPGDLVPSFSMLHVTGGNGARIGQYRDELKNAESRFGPLWPSRDHELVPTTFARLGRLRTLRLMIHGYLMAREAITLGFVCYEPPPIPEPEWFAELVPPAS